MRPGRGERRELASLVRVGTDGRVDLGDHRRHPGREDPLLGRADDLPASIDRPGRVGDVAAPQAVGRDREAVRTGELRLAHRVELEGQLAEQGRRALPASLSISMTAVSSTVVRKMSPTGSQVSAVRSAPAPRPSARGG